MKKLNRVTEDWQTGEKTKVNYLQRITLHEEWLKNIHKEIKEATSNKEKEETEKFLGGFED